MFKDRLDADKKVEKNINFLRKKRVRSAINGNPNDMIHNSINGSLS